MNTCPEFPEPPRRLLAAWWSLALVALGLSTLMAIVLVMARTPFLGLGGEFFRTALVLHVDLAVVIWFLAVGAGIWVVSAPGFGPISFGCAWWGARLAAGGVILILISPWWGGAVPVLANYIPVIDSVAFLCGLAAFGLGVFLSAAAAVSGSLMVPKDDDAGQGRRMWQWAAGAALISFMTAVAVFSLAQLGAGSRDLSVEDRVWGAGHVLQNVHTLMLMAAWLLMGEDAFAKIPGGRRLIPVLLVMALLPSLADLGLAIAFPAGSIPYRHGFTEVMRWATWPGPVILGFLLVTGYRRLGRAMSLADRGIISSLALFILGGIVGATIRGESTAVPAHYHGTVGAVTLAYMLWGRHWAAGFGLRMPSGLAWKLQPFIYASGIALLVLGLAWSGWLGVPRKAPHAELLAQESGYFIAMGIAGVGGFLALLGAGMFVVRLCMAIWQKRSDGMRDPKPATETEGKRYLGMADERWRLPLLAVILLVLGGFVLELANKPPLNGKVDPVGHVEAKRKEEAAKRRAEVDKRFQEGVIMLHAKQYDHALTAFHRVLELVPDMPEAHVNAGFALLGMGQAKAARDFFDSATTLRPNQLNAYFGLAEALEALGDNFGAMQAMETYVHLAPKDDPFRRKAESAAWELREKLAQQKGAGQAGGGAAPPAANNQTPEAVKKP